MPLKDTFTKEQLRQIEHISVDAKADKMWKELKKICPNLKSLELDKTHPIMMYEAA